ncbi:MAG: hypothetical protein K2X99_07340 [Gemmatimonadaceae bacterium]|nr:hypothetical protein [Gemmatimonadaceae bacterium]
MFSAYHLTDDTAGEYLDAMDASGYRWIHGYPSQIALLAAHAERLGRRPRAPRWITLGAESLMPAQREIITRVFGTAPLQHYGMAEGVANVSQCERGSLHVDEDFSCVEFIPAPDGRCRVVGTNFTNWAFPLLRYDVGDLARVSDSACACGRRGRRVEELDGRIEDYLVTARGVRVGRIDHVFKDMEAIVEAQVIQEVPGVLQVQVVARSTWTDEEERRLRSEFATRLGSDAVLELRLVPAIPRTSSGKLRLVVQRIPDAQLVRG